MNRRTSIRSGLKSRRDQCDEQQRHPGLAHGFSSIIAVSAGIDQHGTC